MGNLYAIATSMLIGGDGRLLGRVTLVSFSMAVMEPAVVGVCIHDDW